MIDYEKKTTIYAIRCKVNGKLYIGRTNNINTRMEQHFNLLRKKKHSNKLLSKDFNNYGEENFEIYILEKNVIYKDKKKEIEYMRLYNTFDEKFGYNQGNYKSKEVKPLAYIEELPPNLYNKK